jgi:hypothetical protein
VSLLFAGCAYVAIALASRKAASAVQTRQSRP